MLRDSLGFLVTRPIVALRDSFHAGLSLFSSRLSLVQKRNSSDLRLSASCHGGTEATGHGFHRNFGASTEQVDSLGWAMRASGSPQVRVRSVSRWDTEGETLMETNEKHYLHRGREALGLSREAVADALGVKARTMKAWELGTRQPSRASYDAWAKFLIDRAEKTIQAALEARTRGLAPWSASGPLMLALSASLEDLESQQAAEMAVVYGQPEAEALREGRTYGGSVPEPRRHDTDRITRAVTDKERRAVAFVEAYRSDGRQPHRDAFMAALGLQLHTGHRLSQRQITAVLRIEKNEAPLPKRGGMRAKRTPRTV